jgi:hypothetical protein
MKIIITFCLLASLLFAGLGILGFTVLRGALATAEEYSPLDFANSYEHFSVEVGFNQEEGRYASYHYHFSD